LFAALSLSSVIIRDNPQQTSAHVQTGNTAIGEVTMAFYQGEAVLH
jgi:hypothetical protein